ncbi:MAG: EF-hand domain-containing protein [Pseudomonadota bacterium]
MKTTLLIGAMAAALSITSLTAEARGNEGGQRADFSTLDADGNGEITQAELRAHAQSRFNEVDANGDGALSAEEMLAARESANSERLERRISRMIERRDANGNGALDFEEFTPGDSRMAARFEGLDADGSGGISEGELEAAKEARGGRKGPRGGGDQG